MSNPVILPKLPPKQKAHTPVALRAAYAAWAKSAANAYCIDKESVDTIVAWMEGAEPGDRLEIPAQGAREGKILIASDAPPTVSQLVAQNKVECHLITKENKKPK
jgi:hypothetical protein